MDIAHHSGTFVDVKQYTNKIMSSGADLWHVWDMGRTTGVPTLLFTHRRGARSGRPKAHENGEETSTTRGA
jgi:hypothetical protein